MSLTHKPDPEGREIRLKDGRGSKDGCNCIWNLGDKEIRQLLLGDVLECHRCRLAIWLDDTSFLSYGRSVAVRYGGKAARNAAIDIWNADFWLRKEHP